MKMQNLHVKFDNFYGGSAPRPPNLGVATAPLPRPHPGMVRVWVAGKTV